MNYFTKIENPYELSKEERIIINMGVFLEDNMPIVLNKLTDYFVTQQDVNSCIQKLVDKGCGIIDRSNRIFIPNNQMKSYIKKVWDDCDLEDLK